MGFFSGVFENTVKAGLSYLLYRYHQPIVDTAAETLDTALDHQLTEAAKQKVLVHYEASKKQFRWAKWLLVIATILGLASGVALRYLANQVLVEEFRFWGKVAYMGIGAIAILILFYITIKVVLVRGLLAFTLTTIVAGYRAAVKILPNIIGRYLSGAIDPVVEPIIKLADLVEFYVLTVLMAAGTVVMFITVFNIHTHLWAFPLVVVAIATLVTVVLRDRKPPVWLRRVAIAMSLVSLVVGALTSISPSLRTVNSIRQECISQYYLYGAPKDGQQVRLCEENVEDGLMMNLRAFDTLKRKRLTAAAQVAEWNALATVILAALEEKPEPENKPKPLDYVVPLTPAPKPVVDPKTTEKDKSTKAQSKKPAAASAPKPAANELLAKILERQKSINKDLGRTP